MEVTPRALAAGIRARHFGSFPTVAPLDDKFGPAQVVEAIRSAAVELDMALAGLSDDDLRQTWPGPVGPLTGQVALDLALTEIVIHRCDFELGLGRAPAAPDPLAVRLLDVLQVWLLSTAPHPHLGEAWSAEVRSLGRAWAFSYDGQAWTDRVPPHTTVVEIASPLEAALRLAGRQLPGLPPSALVELKTYLPGP